MANETYRYLELRVYVGPWGFGWGRDVRPKPFWWGPAIGRHYSGFRLGLTFETWRG